MDASRITAAIKQLECGFLDKGHSRLVAQLHRPDAYLMTYRPIIEHFANMGPFTMDGFLLAVTIVYGWMPTSLKFKSHDGFNNICNLLNDVRGGRDPRPCDYSDLKRIINNSIVGTSKLLHFIAPSRFPIWDSKICKAITGSPTSGQTHDNPDVYMAYRTRMLELVSKPDAQETITSMRSACKELDGLTDLRVLELHLFYSVASKRRRNCV